MMHRERFRAYALDGALLCFQPASGMNLRLQVEGTQKLTRRAPRVALFGITNRCNLSCSFCSRGLERGSQWTVESAVQMLQGLAAAGTLEVAFGGGEPLAFRGFAELIAELYATTPLALNVTTNGTLLSAARLDALRGKLGQVRLSIYDDPRWRMAAHTLHAAGQLWGANLLVDARRLPQLPALFAELAALGCEDIALLNYVGGDPALQLDLAGRERLAACIADAPLPCRVRVCFGDNLRVPRIFEGADDSGDCGAGYDFVTLTSDRRLQSCSFQEQGLPVETADQVLEHWRTRQSTLRRASERRGCARQLPLLEHRLNAKPVHELRAWRAFSGNNSGECILVGKFESSEAAQRYVEELRSTWNPDEDYPEAWRALFAQENVRLASTLNYEGKSFGQCPRSMVALGRSVLAAGYDSDDSFPELRALTWKRAGYVTAGGIHMEDPPSLLAAIRCRDAADASTLHAREAELDCHLHGDLVFVQVPNATRGSDRALEEHADALRAFAGDRPIAAELMSFAWDDAAFLAAKQRLGVALPQLPRLVAYSHGLDAAERARKLAGQLGGQAFGRCVLIEGVERRKRLAVLAMRQDADVDALEGLDLQVHGWFWIPPPPRTKGKKVVARELDENALRALLSTTLGKAVAFKPGPAWSGGVNVEVTSREPATVLACLTSAAQALDTELHLWLRDVEPMQHLLRRLLADLA